MGIGRCNALHLWRRVAVINGNLALDLAIIRRAPETMRMLLALALT